MQSVSINAPKYQRSFPEASVVAVLEKTRVEKETSHSFHIDLHTDKNYNNGAVSTSQLVATTKKTSYFTIKHFVRITISESRGTFRAHQQHSIDIPVEIHNTIIQPSLLDDAVYEALRNGFV
jgi:hypothetical protein